MDTNLISWAMFLALSAACLIVIPICGYYMWLACRLFGVRIEHRENEADWAEGKILQLLEQADRHLLIYEDGGPSAGSLCGSRQALSALERRMADRPQLAVKVLLNERPEADPLGEMRRRFGDRLQVRHRSGKRPSRDIHFHIGDDRFGLFSERKPDDALDCHYYDASLASTPAQVKAFGAHRRYLDDQFAAAAA